MNLKKFKNLGWVIKTFFNQNFISISQRNLQINTNEILTHTKFFILHQSNNTLRHRLHAQTRSISTSKISPVFVTYRNHPTSVCYNFRRKSSSSSHSQYTSRAYFEHNFRNSPFTYCKSYANLQNVHYVNLQHQHYHTQSLILI